MLGLGSCWREFKADFVGVNKMQLVAQAHHAANSWDSETQQGGLEFGHVGMMVVQWEQAWKVLRFNAWKVLKHVLHLILVKIFPFQFNAVAPRPLQLWLCRHAPWGPWASAANFFSLRTDSIELNSINWKLKVSLKPWNQSKTRHFMIFSYQVGHSSLCPCYAGNNSMLMPSLQDHQPWPQALISSHLLINL